MVMNMIDELLQQEAYLSYKFLMDHTVFEEGHPGCGLTLDRTSKDDMATIAASGFMLSGLVIGVERGWDTYETNLQRAYVTLKNFNENIANFLGIFVHYADPRTGKRYKKCEYSTIDTAIFLNGMLTVDTYFKEDKIHELVKSIYERIDWNIFTYKRRGHLQFRMAYNDITGGDYLEENQHGWIYHWSMLAEQMTMYFLAAGSKDITNDDALKLFMGFDRYSGGYNGHNYLYSPMGSLFVYQYSHAWLDFSKYLDTKGFDWFKNSQEAVVANYEYCRDNADRFKTFKDAWGLSACDGPKGYVSYGHPPFGWEDELNREDLIERTDGTIALYALLSSLPFQPDLVKRTVKNVYEKFPTLFREYGFIDSFNNENGLWVGEDYLGIDKGITLLMIDNYYHGTTWKYYEENEIIKRGLEKLQFQRKE